MTEERKKKLLNKLKARVSNTTLDLDFYLDKAENYFLNYCNRNDVPENADFIIYDLALSLLMSDGIIKSEDEVKQIHRGDTTITYKDDKKSISVFDDFKGRLNKFRKLNLVSKE